ncbi:type IV secretion system protein [Sphingomonas sp. FARSPH]|uniref:type IV secretion system protein n=1 Tax=Sphingomonas sp. FARSPH TaxID=2219696 RepID=UPI001E29FE19|nr:type IV secretion system protein [Sphingomonas sp. FARSPH]
MRKMKLVALSLVGSTLLAGGPAYAQFGGIVHDPTAFARQLQELNEARKVVAQTKQQIDEAQKLYQDLNKATDIGRIAQSLKTDALRTTDVSSSNLDGYTSGDLNVVGGLRGRANDVYQDLMGRVSPNAPEGSRTAYEQGAREAAVTAGLAGNVGDSVSTRRQGLEELRGRLNTATSAAERSDMTARLQLEQAQMMNDQLALQAIEIQRRAKAEAGYQAYQSQRQQQRSHMLTQMGVNE